ncbi:MAG: hypothetical protein ACLP7P_07250 [Rhodomicrobium sp.]
MLDLTSPGGLERGVQAEGIDDKFQIPIIRSFTALVPVWYVISLGKAWYCRRADPGGASS